MASVRQRKCARKLFATLQGPQGEQLAQDLGMKGDVSFKQVLAYLLKRESDLLDEMRAAKVKAKEERVHTPPPPKLRKYVILHHPS